MAASVSDLEKWFRQGITQNASYMVVVCDTFDWEDYPIYAKDWSEMLKVVADHNGVNMQKVMEVYDLWKSWESQLDGRVRADKGDDPKRGRRK